MRVVRTMKYIFSILAAMLIAAPAFAQGAGNASPAAQWVPLAAGLSMALAAGLCGLAQGDGLVGRGAGSESGCAARHLHLPDPWPGIYRVAGAVYVRNHRSEGCGEPYVRRAVWDGQRPPLRRRPLCLLGQKPGCLEL